MIAKSSVFLVFLVICPLQGDFFQKLSDAAIETTKVQVVYDPAYRAISYPNGDVAADRGVCTDLVIRAYRKLGIDLQKEVHEDMKTHFSLYPKNWGLSRPDPNIDHRRVPNLMKFFERHGMALPVTSNPDDYYPGHIVTWDLGRGVPHIGIVVDQKSPDGNRYLIAHNIGRGQELADCLFEFTITGHYQYGKL